MFTSFFLGVFSAFFDSSLEALYQKRFSRKKATVRFKMLATSALLVAYLCLVALYALWDRIRPTTLHATCQLALSLCSDSQDSVNLPGVVV